MNTLFNEEFYCAKGPSKEETDEKQNFWKKYNSFQEFNIFADKSSHFQDHWVINQTIPAGFYFYSIAWHFFENGIVLQSGFVNKINDRRFLVWAEGNGGRQSLALRGQGSDTSSYHLYSFIR